MQKNYFIKIFIKKKLYFNSKKNRTDIRSNWHSILSLQNTFDDNTKINDVNVQGTPIKLLKISETIKESRISLNLLPYCQCLKKNF